MLRDPVDRVVSGFFFEDRIWKGGRNTTSLVAYAQDTGVPLQKYGGRNHQVAQLAGALQRCSLTPQGQLPQRTPKERGCRGGERVHR